MRRVAGERDTLQAKMERAQAELRDLRATWEASSKALTAEIARLKQQETLRDGEVARLSSTLEGALREHAREVGPLKVSFCAGWAIALCTHLKSLIRTVHPSSLGSRGRG